jgi:DNA-binding transcriptional ArsR family regulator
LGYQKIRWINLKLLLFLTIKWGIKLTEEESAGILKGTSFDIYRLLLTSTKPLGVREIQRRLNLSSPSIVQYHLAKLEQANILRREMGNYVVNKLLLENCIKISTFLIPRYLFYSIFAGTILFIEVLVLKPAIFNNQYYFATIAILVFFVIFCYETIKVWLRGSL